MALSSYATDARRQVGRYLVQQAGYSQKTETNYYKQGDNVLTHVSFQRSRGMTQLYVGIVPLYIPDSLQVLYATNLTNELPVSILLEDDNAQRAKAWAEGVIKILDGGVLTFWESISAPQPLLDYLTNSAAIERRFVLPPIERHQLICFSAAYLGDVSFAVEHVKTAQQKIKVERIDTLSHRIAQYDREIAKIRVDLVKNNLGNTKYFEELICRVESEKRLATLDAEQNAPRTIRKYGEWIEPFLAPGFSSEEYFAQIVDHNKMCLKYDKVFSTRIHKRR